MRYKPNEMFCLLTEPCVACPVSCTVSYALETTRRACKIERAISSYICKEKHSVGDMPPKERQGIEQLGTFVGVDLSAILASADVWIHLQQPFSNSFQFESLFSARLHSPVCAEGLARLCVPWHTY